MSGLGIGWWAPRDRRTSEADRARGRFGRQPPDDAAEKLREQFSPPRALPPGDRATRRARNAAQKGGRRAAAVKGKCRCSHHWEGSGVMSARLPKRNPSLQNDQHRRKKRGTHHSALREPSRFLSPAVGADHASAPSGAPPVCSLDHSPTPPRPRLLGPPASGDPTACGLLESDSALPPAVGADRGGFGSSTTHRPQSTADCPPSTDHPLLRIRLISAKSQARA